MKKEINIRDIELKREGFEEVLTWLIRKYENESSMEVESIIVTKDNRALVLDKLSLSKKDNK